jgi:excisionase family DNA binding protein
LSFEPKLSDFTSIFPKVMTEKEAAEYLRLSTKTLQRRRRAGQISYIRDGGIRYIREDLDAYLAARRIAAVAPPPTEQKTRYQRTGTRSESNRKALLDII